jgi:hypothetical protein
VADTALGAGIAPHTVAIHFDGTIDDVISDNQSRISVGIADVSGAFPPAVFDENVLGSA